MRQVIVIVVLTILLALLVGAIVYAYEDRLQGGAYLIGEAIAGDVPSFVELGGTSVAV